MMHAYGAVEAGGTKFVCGVGTDPDSLRTVRIPTTTPEQTISSVIEFFRNEPIAALGIGSFGPIETNRTSAKWGHITSTPKTAWQNCDLAGPLAKALGVPIGFDTDVNAALLGEARWGAAQDFKDALYLTVGTGIGGGAMAGGRIIHGTSNPEMGHIRIPGDWAGNCPWHGNCLEGLASGPAIEARWGQSAHKLPPDHPAWGAEVRYLAHAVASFICTLAPEIVILGGGVMHQPALLAMVRAEAAKLLNGYVKTPPIVAPGLGDRAGVCGALVLAEQAL